MRTTVTCLLFIAGCAAPQAKSPIDAASGAGNAQLADLFRRHWDWQMRTSPLWATQLGDHRFDDQLGDQSQEAFERNDRTARAFLDEARRLKVEAPADRVHLRLFSEMLQQEVDTHLCHSSRWQVSTFFNDVLGWNEL